MKYLSILCCSLISTLFASPYYKGHSIEGDRFKIQFNCGAVFDACACGCEKDAEAALSQWNFGDEIEIYPFAQDAKGSIFLLKNLENGTEVYSWIQSPPLTSHTLLTMESFGALPRTLMTNDGKSWVYKTEDSPNNWKKGDPILICKNAYLESSEFLLINLNNASKRYITAFYLDLPDNLNSGF